MPLEQSPKALKKSARRSEEESKSTKPQCCWDLLENLENLVGWLVGWFSWHINHCWVFNAKSSLYIYNSEHKDQNDVKKKSTCEITFYFKAS